MKDLLCLISVPDKDTRAEYKEGNVYPFDDTKVLERSNMTRAEEILSARTKVDNKPYFVEVTKDEEVEEVTEEQVQAVASAIVETAEEENKKTTKKTNKK